MVDLTEEERKIIMAQLFDEAVDAVRQMGCTCTPKWSLTEEELGPYGLKAWMSDHADDCAMVTSIEPEGGV